MDPNCIIKCGDLDPNAFGLTAELKASATAKLVALGLTEEEVKSL